MPTCLPGVVRGVLAVDASGPSVRPVLGARSEEVVEDVDDGADAALRSTVMVLQRRVEGPCNDRDVGVCTAIHLMRKCLRANAITVRNVTR